MPPKKKGGKKKGGKKKGGKKKTLTAEEKLELKCHEFTAQEELHEAFIRRVNIWMLEHHARASDLFKRFDKDGNGFLTYAEFFAGMRDLDAPCTQLELYALAKAVDKDNNGQIDYSEFSAGVKYERPVKVFKDDGLPILKIIREEKENCPHCKVDVWTPADYGSVKYICLEVKLLSLIQMRNYPGHFQVYVHAHVLISSIIEMIKERRDGTIRNITLFYENAEGLRVLLYPEKTMEESGFPGGSKSEPQQVNFFYEYQTDLSDCPIIQCDHYFVSDKVHSLMSREAQKSKSSAAVNSLERNVRSNLNVS